MQTRWRRAARTVEEETAGDREDYATCSTENEFSCVGKCARPRWFFFNTIYGDRAKWIRNTRARREKKKKPARRADPMHDAFSRIILFVSRAITSMI